MFRAALLIASLLPGLALAAGGGDSSPPTPTETTQKCSDGQIFDTTKRRCVAPQESHLDDDTLYGAAREFAYAGQYQAARDVLARMSDQTDGRVQTYLGFTARKLGNMDQAMTHYQTDLAQNPDSFLARLYMGQGLVAAGDLQGAARQLIEIRARGGAGSWAEMSLASAIQTGTGYNY